MKIVHFRKNCIGCNSCVEHDASIWAIDSDGKATLQGAREEKGVFVLPVDEAQREANERAARDCPSRIIKIEK